MNLEAALPRFAHQFEKTDEVRLPGPVRPYEDVERTEFDLGFPNRLPPSEPQADQLCHVKCSFDRCPRTRGGEIETVLKASPFTFLVRSQLPALDRVKGGRGRLRCSFF